MGDWIGHRDLCPIQWGGVCDCPCSSIACPGVDRCRATQCAEITGLEPRQRTTTDLRRGT